MTALVQSQHAPNGGATSFTVSITSAAGNALVCYITAWRSGSGAFSLTSVADSAGNTWAYSSAAQNQNPPAGGSYDSAQSQYGFSAIAVCAAAAAVTSVTVTLSAGVSYGEVGVSEFSGLPSGSGILAAASSGTLASGVTSYTVPSVSVTSGALAVATASPFNGFSGVSSGWSLLTYTDSDAAYNLSASGTVQPVFTGPSSDVPSSAIVAIGAGGSPPPPASSGLLMATGI